MLLRRSTDIYPQELARDMLQFFNSRLDSLENHIGSRPSSVARLWQQIFGRVRTSMYRSPCDRLLKDSLMPDVGLTSATQPLPSDAKLVIKYSVQVEGLPVYQETYDVDKLAAELKADRSKFTALWLRRVECIVDARDQPAFSASLTGCLADGLKQ